jgi:hypothetical protein
LRAGGAAAATLLGLLATGAAGCRASAPAAPAATPTATAVATAVTPAATAAAPVVRALPELSIERLRADFNRDVGRQRLLALVSPS